MVVLILSALDLGIILWTSAIFVEMHSAHLRLIAFKGLYLNDRAQIGSCAIELESYCSVPNTIRFIENSYSFL